MNIFIFSLDHETNVRYYPDQYVSKMVLETAQMLCTALRSNIPEKHLIGLNIYKAFNPNHPCCKWTAESYSNFKWLASLGYWINKEFNYRYGHNHLSVQEIDICIKFMNENKQFIPYFKYETKFTDFPQCMPDKYKVSLDVVQSYRNYFIGEKLNFAKWTKRPVPEWINNNKATPAFSSIIISGVKWKCKEDYIPTLVLKETKSGDRNKPCACGSGKKFKKCCGGI